VLRRLLLALSAQPGLGRALEAMPVSQRVVRRFVAGRTADEALAVLAGLEARGLPTAVTYLGENVASPAAAGAAADVYADLLGEIHRRGLGATPSVKLTHLGLDLGVEVARAHVERVLEAARGVTVWLDMEDTRYTDRTLDLYRALRPRWPNVACVLQAYLRRSEADVRALAAGGLRVRLCKGAYREPPDRAWPSKGDVDRSYARLAGGLLEATALGAYPAFATHDERLIRVIAERARALGLSPDRFEFQVLHGIRTELQDRLAAEGLRVRVLVPFGEDWYGYFMRRLAERPANLALFLQSLVRG
jgi:proline dehydrogenase